MCLIQEHQGNQSWENSWTAACVRQLPVPLQDRLWMTVQGYASSFLIPEGLWVFRAGSYQVILPVKTCA